MNMQLNLLEAYVLMIFIKTYNCSGLEEYYFCHQFIHDLPSKETTGVDMCLGVPHALQQGDSEAG